MQACYTKKSYKHFMLSSQPRTNKKNNAPPSSHANYFFVEPCQRQPTLPQAAMQAWIYFAISFQSVNSKASGSKAASLFFYFFWPSSKGQLSQPLNSGFKNCRRRRKYPNTLKRMPAALPCKKNINDCPEAALKFIVYAGQSFIFFSLLL